MAACRVRSRQGASAPCLNHHVILTMTRQSPRGCAAVALAEFCRHLTLTTEKIVMRASCACRRCLASMLPTRTAQLPADPACALVRRAGSTLDPALRGELTFALENLD